MCTGSESVGREQVRSRKCMGREKVSREKTNTHLSLSTNTQHAIPYIKGRLDPLDPAELTQADLTQGRLDPDLSVSCLKI